MPNEHIGRLRKVGIGKESVAGTPVAATSWIPKSEGKLEPTFETVKDPSSFGSIVESADESTVKQLTKAKIEGSVRDTVIGDFLLAALGQGYACLKFVMAGGTGAFQVGENVSQATSSATGVVRRVEGTAGSQTVYISITSGTFDNSHVVTGGTSSATGTAATLDTALRTHVFTLLNSNNHPSYTLWDSNPVETIKAAYGMLDTLELELATDSYFKFSSQWQAKKHAADTATPAYATADNAFVARHASLKVATALSGLGAALAIDVAHIKLTIKKNLAVYQKFGSNDIQSQHNQSFSVAGEISAIFNASTYRDYIENSNKKAMRLTVANTDVTIGSAGNPALQIDLAKVGFADWGLEGNEGSLVMQKLGFEALFSISDAEAIAALLTNTKTTAY